MYAYHNSQSPDYRQPFGAVPVGTELRLWLDVIDPVPGQKCFVRHWQNGKGILLVPMHCDAWGGRARFSVTIQVPDEPGLLWYSFVLEGFDGRTFYGCNADGLGGEGQMYGSSPKSYQVTVYLPSRTPDWFKDGIAYQIFPDRFFRGKDWLQRQADSIRPDGWQGPKRVLRLDWDDTPHYDRLENNDIDRWDSFGGTLEGIREKLPYLKNLGVSVLYLNPIFEAASNHKYDTADYLRVDPSLGDDESFQALIDSAKALGIHIILDGVFNHTGADSKYFNLRGNYGPGGAAQDPDSPYASWFRFRHWPDNYECWWGVKDLPNVEESDPGYREFITGKDGVIRHWLKKGIGGWRLDVADELPDEFIADIRAAMEAENPDIVLLGEVWEDASNKVSYDRQRKYLLGQELHSTMNYPFRQAGMDYMLGRISPQWLCRLMMSLMENYPKENFYGALNLIGSHDRARILTLLGDPPNQDDLSPLDRERYRLPPEKLGLARRRLELLSLIQFTMPGVPCIYYGDEAGAQGFTDPYNRGTFPWGHEDGALRNHYRDITTLRRHYPALTQGSYQPQAFCTHVYGCRRELDGTVIQLLLNRAIFQQETETVTLPAEAPYALDLLTARWYEAKDGQLTVELPPLNALLLLWKQEQPKKAPRTRSAGVICPVAALPAGNGKPTLTDGKHFIDFLHQAGQRLWQVLPINPVGLGNSPYYSPASFAGDPAFIDRDEEPDWSGLDAFCEENAWWLDDYALYTALKPVYDNRPWYAWPEAARKRTGLPALREAHAAAIAEAKRDQYWFWTQWASLKDYAHAHGVTLIGDLPLGVSDDSADVWASPEQFQLDETGRPSKVAGVPPDYFNPDGQSWGNPIYDWEAMARDGYAWWVRRIRHALDVYDFLRLDHFRGFSEYFAIPAGQPASEGLWQMGPGMALFEALEKSLGGTPPILGEDLGHLDAEVYNLLRQSGFPGMDVFQFEQHKMETASPEDARERIYYGSTHDSATLRAWCETSFPEEDPAAKSDEILRWLYHSEATWVLTQLQDLLGLGDEARYNSPGTVGPHNWSWRAQPEQLTPDIANKFESLAREANRI